MDCFPVQKFDVFSFFNPSGKKRGIRDLKRSFFLKTRQKFIPQGGDKKNFPPNKKGKITLFILDEFQHWK